MSIDWFDKYQRQIRQLERWLEPQRHWQKQMDKLLERQHRLQEQVDKWHEPQRRLQEQMDKWLEPPRRLQEQMNKWFEPKWQFQENLNIWKQPLELETFISNVLSQTEYENITINESGTISVEDNMFSANEFSDIYNELIESIQNLPSPFQALNVIWAYLQKIKTPIATLLIIIILPFILNITSNLATSYFENIILELTNKPKREKIKTIRQEAQSDFTPDILKEYRFITATILNVRNGSSIKYKVIDEISFGQVIRLVKKGRQWSSIEYIDDETGQKTIGWVFSRYLSKFKK